MREIKFRAWDKNSECMHLNVEVGVYEDPDEWTEFDTVLGLERFEVMQFTGLKDKSGREIYEGDIVDTTYDGSTFIGVVVYDLSELDFKATDGKEHYRQNFQYLPCCDEIEVIGNVYENPELLEVVE